MLRMGRINGKLTLFVKEGLESGKYPNLQYEPGSTEFYVDFPRFRVNMSRAPEQLLIDWFHINNKTYFSYSNGKAVLKAALKKSIYIMCLDNIGTRMRYRFGTPEEVAEKKRLQKEKQNRFHKDIPSVSSSGYDSSPSSPEELAPCVDGKDKKLESQGLPDEEGSISLINQFFPSFGDLLSAENEDAAFSLFPTDSPGLSATEFPEDALMDVYLTDPCTSDPSEETSLIPDAVMDGILYDENNPVGQMLPNQEVQESAANILTPSHLERCIIKEDSEVIVKNEGVITAKEAIMQVPPISKIRVQSLSRKTIWRCVKKVPFLNFVIYVCESITMESANPALLDEIPEKWIGPEYLEEGKTFVTQFEVGECLCLVFA